MKTFIFFGPPGAGKGTFAGLLVKDFHFAHISTGDMLRAEIKNDTPLGRRVKGYMDTGGLVPDEIIVEAVNLRLQADDVQSNGFILDGFPRTVRQAELLDDVLARHHWALDAAVLFDTDRELLIKRLTSRRLCKGCGRVYNLIYGPPEKANICDDCGAELYQRSDDSKEIALGRIKVYDQQTAPLIDLYDKRGLLKRIDSGGALSQVDGVIREALGL